jgi:hypothetical protein
MGAGRAALTLAESWGALPVARIAVPARAFTNLHNLCNEHELGTRKILNLRVHFATARRWKDQVISLETDVTVAA